jgi:peptidoglycan-associated lipoprotein
MRLTWILLLMVGVVFSVSCHPKYPKCAKDSHCHKGEYCVNGLCQQCRDTKDCGAGEQCVGGACRAAGTYCTTSAQCAAGQVCRSNTCGPCMASSECATGQVCSEGACIVPECTSTADCDAGLSCVNNRCKVDAAMGAAGGAGACQLESAYFDFDSSELSSQARDALERDAACLNRRTDNVVVEGHCDPRGTTEYNMALGDRRATTVRNILKSYGVPKSRMRAISKGEEEATGSDESSWARDRRADVKP